MAENNSSATLLPCPFCGGEADIQSGARGMWNIAGCKDVKCSGFRASGWHDSPNDASAAWNVRVPQAVAAQAPAAVADEMSPEFTDTARAALMWVLWHHQGSSSEIGTAMRFSLGMGKFDRLNDHQLSEAKRWAEIKGVTKAASTGVAAPSKHLALQWCAGALQEMANERDTVRMAGLGESLTIGEILDMADMALATPALPATEDSSAGDLAEVQAEPTDAEIIDLNDGERYFSMSESRFGKDVNPHTQYDTGEPGYLQFARAVLARWGAAPQAQPADALDAEAIEELYQLGYTFKDDRLIPPEHVGELMAVVQASACGCQYGTCETKTDRACRMTAEIRAIEKRKG